jgi:hypothetical protein
LEYPALRACCWVEARTHILTNRIFVTRMRKALDLPYCVYFQPRNFPVHRVTSSIVNSLELFQHLDTFLQLDHHLIGDVWFVGLQ